MKRQPALSAKMIALASLLYVFALGITPAQCLDFPEIIVPNEWFSCQNNSDCAVAGDSCRSCGALTIINKNYLPAFEEKDRKLREKFNIAAKCEACSHARVILQCKDGTCAQGQTAP